jgi:hypothetical protein
MMRNAGTPGDGDALKAMHAARPPGAAAGLGVARVSLALVAASLTVLGDPPLGARADETHDWRRERVAAG